MLKDFLEYSLLYFGVCECIIISVLFGGEVCMNANYFVNIIVIEETLPSNGGVELKTVRGAGNVCWVCGPRDCKVSVLMMVSQYLDLSLSP